MHVGGITVDLNWLLQFIFAVFLIGLGLLYLVKNTASKYFEVDANFEGGGQSAAADTNNNNNCFIDRHQYSRRQSSSRSCHTLAMAADMDATSNDSSSTSSCPICGNSANKKCSRCKSVRYCSQRCQETDWNSGHKSKCKGLKVNSTQSTRTNFGFKASGNGGRGFSAISLVPASGTSKFKPFKMPGKVLFPYDEFIKLYHSNKPAFPPCGLLNCGNSCFANVVLQCLTYTRPLVAYLLDKGHQTECRRNDWCFLCVFQSHVERSSQSSHPFSPMNILSRLPNIGGNLGYGRQEDAHEFMRFAIDTMQSVCLDEFGGEKAVDPATQETTIIQHIFGGQLQSQVICTKCNKISNQFENMMDLTVEIHGDAASLEECLDQFTAKEALHGDNMYKCDGCNGYVKAWKRLTIRRAPNILTIALKRFQSGRFGKLNKRVTFPETLDLSPYMSEEADGTDVYKLYAVVVHVDMLNASFFGHYICYIKDFHGNWHRIDDCKVSRVDLEEVLSQGAYMLLYSRVSVRQSCLRTIEPPKKQQSVVKVEFDSCLKEQGDCPSATELMDTTRTSGSLTPGNKNSEVGAECCEDVVVNFEPSSAFSNGVSSCENESSRADLEDPKVLEDNSTSELCLSAMEEDYRDKSVAMNSRVVDEDPEPMAVADSGSNPWACSLENGSSASEAVLMEYSDHADGVMSESSSAEAKEAKVNGSIYSCASEEISTKNGGFKCELSFPGADSDNGNGAKRAEIINGY